MWYSLILPSVVDGKKQLLDVGGEVFWTSGLEKEKCKQTKKKKECKGKHVAKGVLVCITIYSNGSDKCRRIIEGKNEVEL